MKPALAEGADETQTENQCPTSTLKEERNQVDFTLRKKLIELPFKLSNP